MSLHNVLPEECIDKLIEAEVDRRLEARSVYIVQNDYIFLTKKKANTYVEVKKLLFYRPIRILLEEPVRDHIFAIYNGCGIDIICATKKRLMKYINKMNSDGGAQLEYLKMFKLGLADGGFIYPGILRERERERKSMQSLFSIAVDKLLNILPKKYLDELAANRIKIKTKEYCVYVRWKRIFASKEASFSLENLDPEKPKKVLLEAPVRKHIFVSAWKHVSNIHCIYATKKKFKEESGRKISAEEIKKDHKWFLENGEYVRPKF